MVKQDVKALVETLYCHGTNDREGCRAIKQLAQLGEPALKAINASVTLPPTSDLPRLDLMDAVSMFYHELVLASLSVA